MLLGALRRVLHLCHLASCLPLLVLVGITSADVVARYALGSSVPDTHEISAMMLGVCISLALAPTTGQGGQVRFDLVLNMLPARAQLAADAFTYGLAAVIFALIGWQAVKKVLSSARSGEYLGAMEIPVWPAKAIFALGTTLTAAALVALLVPVVVRLLKR